ncbi:MAG: hypothetical protein SFW67_19930 [Myxococcaceae bacterium]|nr:hypothetical protein [Myxococcaceae bacterium]
MTVRRAFFAGCLAGLVVVLGGCPGERCSADTCLGCCTAAGVCEAGNTASACGRGGVACEACAGGSECARQACGPSGTGGGDAGSGCVLDGRCGSNVCNITSRLCETPDPCPAGAPQPAGCGPGLFCSNGQCREAPRPTCENFPAQAVARRYDPSVHLAPVLLSARKVSFAVDDAGCPAGSTRRGVVELEAYDRLGRFGPDGGLPRLFVYRPNMIPGTISTSDVQVAGANDGTTARLTVQSCGPEAITSIVLGYAYEGGNGLCVSLAP